MNSPLLLNQVIIAIFASAILILGTRIISFVLFTKREPPFLIQFIERYCPSLILMILLVYCLKDLNFSQAPFGLPYIGCILLTAILHLTLKNTMVSIIGSTFVYVLLTKLM